jgi:signal transduction histidine kinase
VRTTDRLSMKARVRVSILALVVTIVAALSVLHLYGVIGETLEDVGERAFLVGEQIKTYIVETVNREAAALTPSASAEQNKARLYDRIRRDPVLPRILEKSLTRSQTVIEVVVMDDQNKVLAASNPQSAGLAHAPIRTFAEWQGQGFWTRVHQLFRAHEDYAVTIPLSTGSESHPVLVVRVLMSSVLLRAAVLPKLRELALISVASLLMSVLLAALVSNLVSRSIQTISEDLDRVVVGDITGAGYAFESPELVNLQSKIKLLGSQFRGVREDVINLRSNIDHLLRNLEEAVIVFGADGRVQMAGEPALRLFGKTRQELAGRTMDDLFPRWTPIGGVLHRWTATRGPVRDQLVRFERPNMAPLSLLINIEPIDYGDRRAGALITLRNAESRQQIRSELDTAQRLSAISRLASGVAHEIKNPLNAMMLHLQIASDKMQRGISTLPELEIITSELARLDRVVKTFLDFNRPLELHLVQCDIAAIVQEVVALLEPEARRRSVNLCMKDGNGPAVINGDPDLLKQCVLNIAMNGLEATRAGGGLDLSVERTGNEYVINVRDEGCGIPPEIHDKIFNLYFTTKPAGSGIGLAIAYRVVQLHSGTITFESEPERGTWFRLRFPISEPEKLAA